MDNSVNNNLNNNVGQTVASNPSGVSVQSTVTQNASVVHPTQAAATSVQPLQTVATTVQSTPVAANNPTVTIPVQPTVGTPNNMSGNKKNDTNTFLIVGFFVGFVLLVAIFLLVLLVTGVIGNRNRLTCTKTINEEGYTHYVERFYKLDKGIYTRVENTDVYTYTSLTDEVYNEKFGPIIEITSGVTEYGFGTKINREGNIVTITSYNPNFFGDTIDDVKSDNAKEGFTCK